MRDSPRVLTLPNPSQGGSKSDQVQHHGQVVIVGANGSGKSRLGAWLENPRSLIRNGHPIGTTTARNAYRVGAQRLLALPNQAQRHSADIARDTLFRGSDGPSTGGSRIQGDPVVGQMNDFAPLLNALFSERTKLEHEYSERGKQTNGNPGKPVSDTLERLKEIWERVFPQRKLVIGDHIVEATMRAGSSTYTASTLSDGERSGLYLIGQVLLAPEGSTFVIDEPELHLHESIQAMLWDSLEMARRDCTFVYITHDLTFAASRTNATKLALSDYIAPSSADETGTWTWDIVAQYDDIPEEIVFRILGSRRPITFVEGGVGGLDQRVFTALYPDRFIVPCGGWESVDKSVRAFNAQHKLHNFNVSGIIDRDDRDDTEVKALKARDIHPLTVAAVENVLALPDCIKGYLSRKGLHGSEQDSCLVNAKRRVLHRMKQCCSDAIIHRARHIIRRQLSQIDCSNSGKQQFLDAVESVKRQSDAASAFDRASQIVVESFNADDDSAYDAVLRVFRNKAILTEVACALGAEQEQYISDVIEIISVDNSLRESLLRYLDLPSISSS